MYIIFKILYNEVISTGSKGLLFEPCTELATFHGGKKNENHIANVKEWLTGYDYPGDIFSTINESSVKL